MTWVGSLCFERPLSVLSLLSFGVCCGLSLYHFFCLYVLQYTKQTTASKEHAQHEKEEKEEVPAEDSDKVESHHVVPVEKEKSSFKGDKAETKAAIKGQ